LLKRLGSRQCLDTNQRVVYTTMVPTSKQQASSGGQSLLRGMSGKRSGGTGTYQIIGEEKFIGDTSG
jgi:hypothetical protein